MYVLLYGIYAFVQLINIIGTDQEVMRFIQVQFISFTFLMAYGGQPTRGGPIG
jgi:hypothetical protein